MAAIASSGCASYYLAGSVTPFMGLHALNPETGRHYPGIEKDTW